MSMDNVAVLRGNSEDAPRVQAILGLPDDRWADVKITFGLDEPALAEVTLILRGDQLVELAKIAHKRIGEDGVWRAEYPGPEG